MNYSRRIRVEEIAHFIGLDRSYLSSIFTDELNTSLQGFIIQFRINIACQLMENRILTIGDISRSVGYDDPLAFSKIFKKIKGASPRDFRKSVNLTD